MLRHGGVTMGGHRTATEDVSLPGKEKKRSGELVAGELYLVIMDKGNHHPPEKIVNAISSSLRQKGCPLQRHAGI